jgi:mannosyltransferase OCH1-like enzyme
MNIPKVIYQTWKTKNVHPTIEQIKQNIQENNPDYTIELFDDDDMDVWMKTNCESDVFEAYNKLHVGAAKADLWRYLILYKNGGVYLDMDSMINGSLDELIQPDDSAIISREGNKGYFMQWMLVFEKNHPILKATIDKCVYNINNPNTTDVVHLTGPGVFTKAIYESFSTHTEKDLWDMNDTELNSITNKPENKFRARFLNINFAPFGQWKHQHHHHLYQGHKYWREEHIFK